MASGLYSQHLERPAIRHMRNGFLAILLLSLGLVVLLPLISITGVYHTKSLYKMTFLKKSALGNNELQLPAVQKQIPGLLHFR